MFGSLDLYLLCRRMSSIIYCQLQKPPRAQPSTESLPSLPFSLPISCRPIAHPILSANHHPSSRIVLCPSKTSNDLLSGVFGVPTSRIPVRQASLPLTIHSMIPIAHPRGGYLSTKLLHNVRRRLGRTALLAHLLACLGGRSSRAIHRKIGHAAPFDDILLT
jgi:hypothetical protein